jgi:guanylate kinase
LHHAFKQFYPELAGTLEKLVLYNSRTPRPGEVDGVDYHFRTTEDIEKLREDSNFIVMPVRADLQALDLRSLVHITRQGDAFFEGNPFLVRQILDQVETAVLTVFLSPLSAEELVFLKDPERNIDLREFVTEVMRKKLLRRTMRQKTNLSLTDLQDIERRAGSALTEMAEAWRFNCVIPNHDGEDSENWDAFYYPLGDARKALTAFVSLIERQNSDTVERWDRQLLEEYEDKQQ